MTHSHAHDETRPAIRRLVDHDVPAGAIEAIDAIFFDSAARHSFASEAERGAFREQWLGRYLEHYRDDVLVAVDAHDRVIGYLVGARANAPLFRDVLSFRLFADLCAVYPAHLHINVAAGERSRGIGALLIRAFLEHLRQHAVPGVHLITGQGARNIRFYERNGFRLLAERSQDGRDLAFLGQRVAP